MFDDIQHKIDSGREFFTKLSKALVTVKEKLSIVEADRVSVLGKLKEEAEKKAKGIL